MPIREFRQVHPPHLSRGTNTFRGTILDQVAVLGVDIPNEAVDVIGGLAIVELDVVRQRARMQPLGIDDLSQMLHSLGGIEQHRWRIGVIVQEHVHQCIFLNRGQVLIDRQFVDFEGANATESIVPKNVKELLIHIWIEYEEPTMQEPNVKGKNGVSRTKIAADAARTKPASVRRGGLRALS